MSENHPEDYSSCSLLDSYWGPAENSWKINEMVPKAELAPHWESNFQLKVYEKVQF